MQKPHHRCKTFAATLPAMALSGLLLSFTPVLSGLDGDLHAEERPVLVEVLIFARSGEQGRDEEVWDPEIILANLEDSLDPTDTDSDLDEIEWNETLSELDSAREKLEDSDDYEVLFTARWRQPEKQREDAPYLRLSRKDEDLDEPDADPGGSQAPVFADPHRGDLLELQPSPETVGPSTRRPLDGTVRVHRNRFFHVGLDLLYHPERDTDEDTDAADDREYRARQMDALLAGQIDFEMIEEETTRPFGGYHLTESRRVRMGETHYIDHPVYGLIVHLRRPD